MPENTKNEHREYLKQQFEAYREREWLYPRAVHDLVESNINYINEQVTGKRGRQLSWCGDMSHSLKTQHGKAYLVLHSKWDYFDGSLEKPPDFGLLRKFSKGMWGRQIFSESNKTYIRADIYVDLAVWFNLVIGTIHKTLSEIASPEETDNKSSEELIDDLDLLLACFYPHLDSNYLAIAWNIEAAPKDCTEFALWLPSLTVAKTGMAPMLPEEINTF